MRTQVKDKRIGDEFEPVSVKWDEFLDTTRKYFLNHLITPKPSTYRTDKLEVDSVRLQREMKVGDFKLEYLFKTPQKSFSFDSATEGAEKYYEALKDLYRSISDSVEGDDDLAVPLYREQAKVYEFYAVIRSNVTGKLWDRIMLEVLLGDGFYEIWPRPSGWESGRVPVSKSSLLTELPPFAGEDSINIFRSETTETGKVSWVLFGSIFNHLADSLLNHSILWFKNNLDNPRVLADFREREWLGQKPYAPFPVYCVVSPSGRLVFSLDLVDDKKFVVEYGSTGARFAYCLDLKPSEFEGVNMISRREEL